MPRVNVNLVVLLAVCLLSGCTQLGPQSRLEGKWQGEQHADVQTEQPVRVFDPDLEFELEFKSDHSLKAKLPDVGVVYGTWRAQSERRTSLDVVLSYSNDGKSKYVQTMSVQFQGDAFVAQPPGAPGPVKFTRVK